MSSGTGLYHWRVSRSQRGLRIIGVLVALGIALALIPPSRRAVLRAAGGALVADDPIRAADAIVVAIDARDAGLLEAADLVRSGISRKVAVFSDAPDAVDSELARRGLTYEDRPSRQMRLLRTLGVEDVERIPLSIDGTESEGHAFPTWCDLRALRSVIVVASADHSRRLRRVFHRAMKGRPTTVMIRRARYSDFDPDRWWQKRDGVRTEIVELEKLLLDFVRHPMS
jgi:hypothetical protein